jgi:hypothetical protein
VSSRERVIYITRMGHLITQTGQFSRKCQDREAFVLFTINEGRGAARECSRYLMGDTDALRSNEITKRKKA